MDTQSFLSHLECGLCGERLEADRLWNLCPKCGKPLLARYDLDAARAAVTPGHDRRARADDVALSRAPSRPRRRLQALARRGLHAAPPVGPARARSSGSARLYVKDEGLNPTGSFKARGLAVAVSRAFELGVRVGLDPDGRQRRQRHGAYAAVAGLEAHVFMPADVPRPFINECRALGAEVTLVDGLITDCGKAARGGRREARLVRRLDAQGAVPHRGQEDDGLRARRADAAGGCPTCIIYPTGGGTGLVGMWKAFDEMEELGWIGRASGRGWSPCRPTAARRSSGVPAKARNSPSPGRTPGRSPTACASRRPSATS